MPRCRRWARLRTFCARPRSNGQRRIRTTPGHLKLFISPCAQLDTVVRTKRPDAGLKRLSICCTAVTPTPSGPTLPSIGSTASMHAEILAPIEQHVNHKHTNALINETSPYLLQHAHNPVNWYPWGEAALNKAKADDKPILLSIGYSACHWCHVMEHESFENEEIAKLMNDNFINIKVDREERPDLDQIYMTAVQMMTGHGGWPMTMFLTPEGVPFYGGTYFPPDDRYNMPGFPRVLLSVAEAYRSQRDQVGNTATQMLGELRRVGFASESRDLLTTEILDGSYRRIAKNYDRVHGGFGGAPKFPPAMTLEFFLHVYHRTRDEEALNIVSETCRKMAEGGMYDQLGGGFHRYSVDAKWLVPHFEKMLYDNALLARTYLEGAQAVARLEASPALPGGVLQGGRARHARVGAARDDVAGGRL